MVKKVLLGVLGVLGLSVVGVCAAASMQPDTTHVERSVTVAATPADVFPYANNFDLWTEWNPWQKIDPNQVVTTSAVHEGKDAWYEWKGNDEVGHGRMTILESTPPSKVVEELHFMAPFESMATTTMTFTANGDETTVTWAFDGKNDFMAKMAGMFMDMDAMLGTSFQKGLDQLKPIAEAAADKRIAAEKAAAEVAAVASAAEPGAAEPGAAAEATATGAPGTAAAASP